MRVPGLHGASSAESSSELLAICMVRCLGSVRPFARAGRKGRQDWHRLQLRPVRARRPQSDHPILAVDAPRERCTLFLADPYWLLRRRV